MYLCYSINKIGNKHTIKTQTNKDIYQRRQKPLNLNFQLFILQKKKKLSVHDDSGINRCVQKGTGSRKLKWKKKKSYRYVLRPFHHLIFHSSCFDIFSQNFLVPETNIAHSRFQQNISDQISNIFALIFTKSVSH